MTVLDLLDLLDRLDVRLAVNRGQLITDAPAGAIDDDLAASIRTHRELLVAVVIGRSTGHALAPCSTCSSESMVAVSLADGKRRTTWPTCRMTRGCAGRHEPRQLDAGRCTHVKRPAQAAPPPRPHRKRLLGEWPTWPDREVS